MRFGQTLFGGAVAGLVIATGSAICDAQASGHNEVTRLGEATGKAYAQGSADVRRAAYIKPVTLTCSSAATGAASVDFRPLPVEILAQAMAAGRASADFHAYAFGDAYARMAGKPVRRIKLFPRQARAYAYGEADAQAWQMGYAKPAIATAFGFGTTYYVGNGSAQASAHVQATPAIQAGAAGQGWAIAEAYATYLYTAGFAGIGYGSASWLIDSAVTRSGVRELDGGSAAIAQAHAFLETLVITQSQTGYGRSSIVAHPRCQIGAKGHAKAVAIGWGDGVGISTGVAAVPGETAATARAKALYQANAKGTGKARASAVGSALVKQTRVTAKPGVGKALAQATAARTCLVSSSAKARATTQAWVRRTRHALPVTVRAVATARVSRIQLSLKGTAQAKAVVIGKGQRLVTAKSAAALVTATGIGANQINDLVRAPLSRTCEVEREARQVLIDAEVRQIYI